MQQHHSRSVPIDSQSACTLEHSCRAKAKLQAKNTSECLPARPALERKTSKQVQTAVSEDDINTHAAHAARLGTRWRRFPYVIAIGALFLLPHLIRMGVLGSIHEYTPFSVTTPNNVVWDESYMYVPQANVTLQQHRWAGDTDSWEHQGSPFPYSLLPAGLEAALAKIFALGHPREGLKWAQILLHFIFPMLTAWMLMLILERAQETTSFSATLALIVMVGAFSAGTVMQGIMSIFQDGRSAHFYATLQASRNPNPNISFAIFLLAMLLLLRGLRIRSIQWLMLAGLVGSALFYSYSYYAIAWFGVCVLLMVAALFRVSRISRVVGWTLAGTIAGAIPYVMWTHAAKASGAYTERVNRFGMMSSHALTPSGRHLTMVWLPLTLVLLIAWLWTWRTAIAGDRRDEMHRTVILVGAAALSGIAGMDMQVVTGFNVQPEYHFSHMVIQPAVALMACLLVGWWLRRATIANRVWQGAFILIFAACTASQVNAAIHSAAFHRMNASDRMLFDWLEANTPVGSVVSTTNLRLCAEIPIYTHNNLLLVNGSRASGSDQEMLTRLMLANQLVGASETRLTDELHGKHFGADGVLMESYSLFLFEHSPFIYLGTHDIADQVLPSVLEQYRRMNLGAMLQKFRVDYIYGRRDESPVAIPGFYVRRVLDTPEGTLWHLEIDRPK
jgi:hypothetical protein